MWSNRILFYMMLYAAAINFLIVGPLKLMTPYIISLTGSETTLGVLLGIFDAGIVIGGILMGILGGTRPRIHGIMMGVLFRAVCIALLGLARTPITLGISLFFLFFTNALIDASFASIVQIKTPPDMQGRVFALLLQIMYIANPLSLLLTGPLVDQILTPALTTDKWNWLTPLVGNQPGSEMGLVMFVSGILIFLVTLGMYTWPRARHCEEELSDYAIQLNQKSNIAAAD
jgi:MFS family permease